MIQKLYTWYGKRTVNVVGAAILLLALISIYLVFFGTSQETEEKTEEVASVVQLKSVRDLVANNSFTAVGTVEAVSEARLQTEAGGRVTAVTAEIGNTVRAGTVIASLENNSERAALLQAQGSYEAALAGAEQSDSGKRDAETGLDSARTGAISAARASYSTANNTLVTSVDQFFSNPEGMVPGLKIDGNTSVLNSERVAFQTLLPKWQANIDSANNNSLKQLLNESEANIVRLTAIVETFIKITSESANNELLADKPIPSYTPGLIAERNALNGALSSIQSARFALESAEEGVLRAEIGGTGSDVSLANAQVKIALGSLRLAQANYEKTLVRSPINGVVNALYLKAGDYVTPGQPAAIIANNAGLEIKTSISQEESVEVAVGDSVVIDGTSTGTISAIGGAIDPTTSKVAVKVSVDDTSSLQNGSTVSVLFTTDSAEEISEIVIPLSAIKMTGSGPVVFDVDTSTNALKATPVTLGAITGESVVVKEGVTLESMVVVDARGLKEGQIVSVLNK
jgi:RND family efflux transporter MFP subunit